MKYLTGTPVSTDVKNWRSEHWPHKLVMRVLKRDGSEVFKCLKCGAEAKGKLPAQCGATREVNNGPEGR